MAENLRRAPSGAAIVWFETIDSTSAEAKRRAAAGERGPVWIVAARQTSGYGRRGSAWLQDVGDLAATLLFQPAPPRDAGPDAWPQLSFAAALAAADAIAAYAPGADVRLKWPNDVLLDGAKIAGLLLETAPGGGDAVCFGLGVNIVSAPDLGEYRATRLSDAAAPPPSPNALLAAADEAFAGWRGVWSREGFAPVRAAWMARAFGLGRRVRAITPDGAVDGAFNGVDDDGALLIDAGEGAPRRILAGSLRYDPTDA